MTTETAPRYLIVLLGSAFLIAAVLLVYSLTAVWPTPLPSGATATPKPQWDPNLTWLWFNGQITDERRLLLLVIITAALGSYIHAATSFTSFVGNETLKTSWILWYVLRAPIGVSLAIIFYCVVRGGLLSSGAVGTDMSPFGVAALSGLVGMFSKQASDKLRETFDNLFRTAPGKGDDARTDKLKPAGLTIKSLDPTGAAAGSKGVIIKLAGESFIQGMKVLVNDADRVTDFNSPAELAVHLTDADTAAAGSLQIAVKAAPPSDQVSPPLTFTVS